MLLGDLLYTCLIGSVSLESPNVVPTGPKQWFSIGDNFPLRGHLAESGDILGFTTWGTY